MQLSSSYSPPTWLCSPSRDFYNAYDFPQVVWFSNEKVTGNEESETKTVVKK